MSADLLRRAARVARETADAATPGPWHQDETGAVYAEAGTYVTAPWTHAETDPDLAHIALWHPVVARAVADWLEGHADAMETDERDYVDAPAEALARLLLKETTDE